ncbi:MAG TPA: type IV secretion system DNA-binding domain-containing protein [Candidatus Saccharimonadales bacterium]|nr:type IV secretion system DNA-binding domain-containing protein [Candidatus Saccharimonadales bacterium]
MLTLDDALNFLGHNLFDRSLSVALLIIVVYLIYRWILEPTYTVLKGMWNFWKMRNHPRVILEITPPKHIEKSPLATQQLFAVIGQLINRNEVAPLEISATRKEGIRYLMHIHPGDAETLQRQLAAYLPDAQFRILESATGEARSSHSRVFEVKQAYHYAYPLQAHEALDQSDPVTFITGAMTKLKPDEKVTMQLVLAPHHSYWTNRLRAKIEGTGYAVLDRKLRYFILSRPIWVWLITAVYGLFTNDLKATASLLLVLLVVSLFIRRDEPELTQAQQEVFAGVLAKLNQPLFRTDIRILVSAASNSRLYDLSSGITSSLAPLNSVSTQQLHMPRLHPDWLGQKMGMFKLERRMPSFFVFGTNILAASELASIYHFPYGAITTEGMTRSHSRTLPAPTLLKNRTDDSTFDVVLGNNNHHGETTNIGLTTDERERHMYIIGGTGNGKTTLLQYAILQDIQNGKGVAVVDPHGDMAAKLLKYIPEERMKDVIYFNPADISNPIGLNLLELPEGLTGDELLLAKDFVTESIVSVFRKIFSEDDSGGHRIEHVLRNAVHTAFAVEGATLFTIRKLLNNPEFRKKVVATLDDEDIKDFWINEFGLAGNYQKYKAMDGVTTKIGRFQRSVVTRRILEQEKSTIDFDEILNGKILICNLAKGSIGEDTSAVLGTAILTRLQLAAYRRINTKEEDRRPFYLYVDEFQNFVSPLFMQILSESRKYKLFLTMAEQSTSQQDRELTENILDNAGTIVCFRTGNPADEELMLHQFKGYIEEGEITHLPKYNFYMRIAAGDAQEAFSGETIVLEGSGDENVAKRAVAASQKNYGKEYIRPKEIPDPSKKSEPATKAKEPKAKAAAKRKTPAKRTQTKDKQAKPLFPKKGKVS